MEHMKETKFKLLKDDYDFVCRQLKEYKQMIEQLRKENEQLTSTVEVGRYEYKELWDKYLKNKEENECLRDELLISKNEI